MTNTTWLPARFGAARGRWMRLVLVLILLGAALACGLRATPIQAADVDGTVVAWGWKLLGQGIVPPGLDNVVAVSAGSQHSLALKADGTVIAWGDNGKDQGNVPSGLTGVVAISAGGYHSLALQGDGTVIAWGCLDEDIYDYDFGQCDVPAGLVGVIAISAGGLHSLALREDGTVVAWGCDSWEPDDDKGQCDVPTGPAGVVAISTGDRHSLALKGDGTVVAWGDDQYDQASIPAGLAGVVAIGAGAGHSLALKGDGTVVAWGNDMYDQGSVPAGLAGVVAISAGAGHNLALKGDGTVVAWGLDLFTQTQVPTGLTGVVAISAGGGHNLALLGAQLTMTVTGGGKVARDPATSGIRPYAYVGGTVVTLTATPDDGGDFLGWTVDGVAAGNTRTLTVLMDSDHAVVAIFSQVTSPSPSPSPLPSPSALPSPSPSPPPSPLPSPCGTHFGDVPAADPACVAIEALADRGVINGCDSSANPPLFCPNDPTLRHQMAALIVRAIPGWANETGQPAFSDNTDDAELMARVGTLQRHGVVRGYQDEVCQARGLTPPCYGPLDSVKNGQVLLFIARAMVLAGYWDLQPDDRTIFPDQNGEAGADPASDQQTLDHRMVVTYIHYVGAPPDVADIHAPFQRSGVTAGGWSDDSSRSWFARAFWPSIQNAFDHDNQP